MAWDVFGLYKEGPQSKREQHVLNVYKDPEFKADIESIFPDHKNFLKELTEANFEQNQKLKERVNEIPEKAARDLARKYSVRLADIWFYLTGNAMPGRVFRERYQPYNISEDSHSIVTVRFRLFITKEDFMQIWKEISSRKSEKLKNKITKNKLPQYDELLYAIFKARQRGETFRKIYEQYDDKKLPYYLNKARPFKTEEKLKEYFYRHGTKTY